MQFLKQMSIYLMSYMLLTQSPVAVTSVFAVNWNFLAAYGVIHCAIKT